MKISTWYSCEPEPFENSPWHFNLGDSHVPEAVQLETVSLGPLKNPSLQV